VGLEGGEIPLGLMALAGDFVEGFDFGLGEEEAARCGGGFGEVGLDLTGDDGAVVL
jgi:hypothetical protein